MKSCPTLILEPSSLWAYAYLESLGQASSSISYIALARYSSSIWFLLVHDHPLIVWLCLVVILLGFGFHPSLTEPYCQILYTDYHICVELGQPLMKNLSRFLIRTAVMPHPASLVSAVVVIVSATGSAGQDVWIQRWHTLRNVCQVAFHTYYTHSEIPLSLAHFINTNITSR